MIDLEEKLIFLRTIYNLSCGGDFIVKIEENRKYFRTNCGLSSEKYTSLLNNLNKSQYFEIMKSEGRNYLDFFNSNKIKDIFTRENYDDNYYEEEGDD